MKNFSFCGRIFVITAFVVPMLSIAVHVRASPDTLAAAKPRIEREFRQLETALSRLMYNNVLRAPNIDAMNTILYEFMRENPGVLRILRTNSAGRSVNDVSSGSHRSEPSRDLSRQQWLRYVTEHRMPYYSADYDVDGELTLFYAWPLMTGVDRTRFSGAYAAVIDFAAQTALIEGVEPFQLAYQGRAFFEYEWDDVEFGETDLEVRGTSEITIRTEKPLPTRNQPTQRGARFVEGDDVSEEEDEGGAPTTSIGGDVTEKAVAWLSSIPRAAVIIALSAIIGILIIYSFIQNRKHRRTPPKFTRVEDRPAPAQLADRVVVQSMADLPTAASPETETKKIPVQPPPIDAEKFSQMLTLIKNEFAAINKKIHIMAGRIEALEKRL